MPSFAQLIFIYWIGAISLRWPPKLIGLSNYLISFPWKRHAHLKHIDRKVWNACHIWRCYKTQSWIWIMDLWIKSCYYVQPLQQFFWLFYQKTALLSPIPISQNFLSLIVIVTILLAAALWLPTKAWFNVKIFSYYWKSKTIKSHVQRHNQQPEWSPHHSLVFMKVAQLS